MGMASLELVELVTSKVQGVPDQLKMETLSLQTISLFVPDYTAYTVEMTHPGYFMQKLGRVGQF